MISYSRAHIMVVASQGDEKLCLSVEMKEGGHEGGKSRWKGTVPMK